MNIIESFVDSTYQSRLAFLNEVASFANFTEVNRVLVHNTSSLSGWYGIESLICKNESGFVYDIDVRHAWSDTVFRQDLIDFYGTESILLSPSLEGARKKLVIYLCEDTMKIPATNIPEPIDRRFLISNYWQEVCHLYLKKTTNHPFDLRTNFSNKIVSDSNQENTNDYLPLVSIVTVVKNGEEYLKQTIQSVINQTYSNIEYIIVDGGSTDGTLDIVKEYEDRISYWVSELDEGISDAFNKGISYSNGFLVGLLSADDLYYQDSVVEGMVNQSFKNPESSFYFGDCLYDSEGSISKVKGDDKYAEKLKFFMPHIHHPTVFMKREVLIETPFSNSYKLCMDYHLFLRLNKKGLTGSRYKDTVSIVRNCGVSNRFYYQTRKEVFKASTEHGTNLFVAGLIYILLLIKYRIKNA
jgi:Glycosyl transferase family 2